MGALHSGLRFFLCAGLLALSQAASAAPGQIGFPPTMTAKERKLVLQSAGFDLSANGQTAVRSCGDREIPFKPGIAQGDFNGDGKIEIVVLSQNTCPGSNGKLHTTILYRDAQGIWQNGFDSDGQIKPAEGRTDGWVNINAVDGATVIPFVHDREGNRYSRLSWVQYRAHYAQATRPDRTPPGTLPTAGWPTPYSIGNLTPGQLAQIFVAAGYKRIGAKWKGCDGGSDADLPADDNVLNGAPIMDMNGDGKPEVIVSDGSYECYGNNGGRFHILTPVPGGWHEIAEAQDMPIFLPTKSRAGWPDFSNGGPGFCHERYRNNGKGYEDVGQYAESPGGCSGR